MYESDLNIPYAGCNYLLKRINSSTLSPLQKLAFDIAFPGFQGLEEPTERQRETMAKAEQQGRPITWQQKPARRYAGD